MNGMKDECECILCFKGPKAAAQPKTVSTFKPRPRVPREIHTRDTTVELGENREKLKRRRCLLLDRETREAGEELL